MNDTKAWKAPGVNDAMKVVWQKHFAFLEHPIDQRWGGRGFDSFLELLKCFQLFASPVWQKTGPRHAKRAWTTWHVISSNSHLKSSAKNGGGNWVLIQGAIFTVSIVIFGFYQYHHVIWRMKWAKKLKTKNGQNMSSGPFSHDAAKLSLQLNSVDKPPPGPSPVWLLIQGRNSVTLANTVYSLLAWHDDEPQLTAPCNV